ncbi:sensor histidine kinase [Pedobacter sp. AW1-32]|uniref:sensor histidine kinase n=1 Tax=Pedobacter sp. AW1-32 TaxID=3383026 RepID=UPI003FEE2B81
MKKILVHSLRLIFALISILFSAKSIAQPTFYKPLQGRDRLSNTALRKLLAQPLADTLRTQYLLALADTYIDRIGSETRDLDSAAIYLAEGYQLALRVHSINWQHNALMEYGQFYAESKQIEKQEQIYQTALKLAQKTKNKRHEADTWFYYAHNVDFEDPSYTRNIAYCKKAMALYQSLGLEERQSFLLKCIADFHLMTGQYTLAEQELLAVLKRYKKIHYPDLFYTYDLLSAVSNKKGNLSKALYYALCTVKACETEKLQVPGVFLRRVSEAYVAIGNRKEAIDWARQAFNYFSEHDDMSMLYLGLYELSEQLVENNEAGKALNLVLQTRRKFQKASQSDIFYYDMARGNCYLKMGKFTQSGRAFLPYNNSYKLKQMDGAAQATAYFNIARYSVALKNFAAAAAALKEMASVQAPINIPVQMEVSKMLFEIDRKQARPESAIQHLQRFHVLRDSLFSFEKLSLIERLQIEFKSAQKENENELLRKKDQLQSQELEREKILKNAILGGIALLLIFIVLLYSRFRLKKRLHNLLLLQNKSLDEAYHELQVSIEQKNQLLEDKEFLIKEVHHRVKNNLQLTMSLLNSQSFYLDDAKAVAAIKESQHRMKSIALIHQKLYQTEGMASIRLRDYILELISYLQESLDHHRKIKFKTHIADIELDVSQAVPLGLCINEAVTNIFKYAFPDNRDACVDISFEVKNDTEYLLFIRDNGIGLPADFDLNQSDTLGITLLKGLSRQLGGELKFIPHHGLTVLIEFFKKDSLAEIG